MKLEELKFDLHLKVREELKAEYLNDERTYIQVKNAIDKTLMPLLIEAIEIIKIDNQVLKERLTGINVKLCERRENFLEKVYNKKIKDIMK